MKLCPAELLSKRETSLGVPGGEPARNVEFESPNPLRLIHHDCLLAIQQVVVFV
jgi:hypothetical protein